MSYHSSSSNDESEQFSEREHSTNRENIVDIIDEDSDSKEENGCQDSATPEKQHFPHKTRRKNTSARKRNIRISQRSLRTDAKNGNQLEDPEQESSSEQEERKGTLKKKNFISVRKDTGTPNRLTTEKLQFQQKTRRENTSAKKRNIRISQRNLRTDAKKGNQLQNREQESSSDQEKRKGILKKKNFDSEIQRNDGLEENTEYDGDISSQSSSVKAKKKVRFQLPKRRSKSDETESSSETELQCSPTSIYLSSYPRIYRTEICERFTPSIDQVNMIPEKFSDKDIPLEGKVRDMADISSSQQSKKGLSDVEMTERHEYRKKISRGKHTVSDQQGAQKRRQLISTEQYTKVSPDIKGATQLKNDENHADKLLEQTQFSKRCYVENKKRCPSMRSSYRNSDMTPEKKRYDNNEYCIREEYGCILSKTKTSKHLKTQNDQEHTSPQKRLIDFNQRNEYKSSSQISPQRKERTTNGTQVQCPLIRKTSITDSKGSSCSSSCGFAPTKVNRNGQVNQEHCPFRNRDALENPSHRICKCHFRNAYNQKPFISCKSTEESKEFCYCSGKSKKRKSFSKAVRTIFNYITCRNTRDLSPTKMNSNGQLNQEQCPFRYRDELENPSHRICKCHFRNVYNQKPPTSNNANKVENRKCCYCRECSKKAVGTSFDYIACKSTPDFAPTKINRRGQVNQEHCPFRYRDELENPSHRICKCHCRNAYDQKPFISCKSTEESKEFCSCRWMLIEE